MAKFSVAPAPAPPTTPADPAKPVWGWKQRAAQFFCLIMLLGFPIFSVPCQKGDCHSPIEVVATYTYAKKMMPEEYIRAMLYPATLMLNAETLMGDDFQSFQFPAWDGILTAWNLTADYVEDESAKGPVSVRLIPNLLTMFETNDPMSLSWEFVGACVVCLIGAVFSVLGPNKISFWGVLLVVWFIFLDGGKREDVYAQPMFALAIICSAAWVNIKELFSFPPREEKPAEVAVEPKVESKEE